MTRTAEHNAKIGAALKARGAGETPTKRCPGCGGVFPRESFGRRRNGYSRSHCRRCESVRSGIYVNSTPERREKARRDNRAAKLRLTYGMDLAEYEALVKAQAGLCAICKHPPRGRKFLAVDHDHSTGAVRALLCGPCNSALGMMQDDVARLRAAADYVEAHTAAREVAA